MERGENLWEGEEGSSTALPGQEGPITCWGSCRSPDWGRGNVTSPPAPAPTPSEPDTGVGGSVVPRGDSCLPSGGVGDSHAALRRPAHPAHPWGHPAWSLERGRLLPAPRLGQAPEHRGECVVGPPARGVAAPRALPRTPSQPCPRVWPHHRAMGSLFPQKRGALDRLLEM